MKWIIFLRGVNVGGHGRLHMKEFRAKLESSSFCSKVGTYIQSGNVLMESELTDAVQLCKVVSGLVTDGFGFTPAVLAMSVERLQEIARDNPYPKAEEDPKTLHVYFLSSVSKEPKLELLETKRHPSESYHLKDDVLYLHAPEGIGRSKLAASVERAIGVSCTARNWRTIEKMLSMKL